jgi:putative ABC transport system permease protein
MFIQTLQSGFRQIWRRPVLPIMNIVGLAAGIAVATVIFLYADVELNYNTWVKNQDNLFRIEGQFIQSPNGGYTTNTMIPLGPAIASEIREVQSVVRINQPHETVKKGQFLNYETLTYTDSGFFSMFPLTFTAGSITGFFDTENRVMLSKSMAEKYFGSTNIIGETLELNGGKVYDVYGIFEDIPDNSDLEIDFVAKLPSDIVGTWNNVNLETYISITNSSDIATVEDKLAILVDEHRPFTSTSQGEMKDIFRLFLQPFDDIHLGSNGRTSSGSIGNYATVYGFIALAIMIVAISVFNYISLATARAVEREKEFCLRKVSGASATQIIKQVMIEMAAQTIPAVVIGLFIASDLLPFFSNFIGVDYSFDALATPQGISVIILWTIALSILAGLYPSIIISRYRPIVFISGGRSFRPGVARTRAVLVFLQFSVTISLIIGAVTINRQMSYINNIDLGFNPENLIILRGLQSSDNTVRSATLRDRIAQVNGVVSTSRSSLVPNDNRYHYEGFISEHLSRENMAGMRLIGAGFNFINTLDARLNAGRLLSDDFADDKVNLFTYDVTDTSGSSNVMINREAATKLGYATPEIALGKQINMVLESEGLAPLTIVGIIENISYESVRRPMEPRIYSYHEPALSTLSIRVHDKNNAAIIDEIEAIWQEMYPETPILLEYMEERIDALYADEQQQLKLFVTFSVLAIILSLIGLIGLVLNSIIHRTREISIRKVLGASSIDNIKLFVWQYLKPVLIANIPAWAVSYYFLSNWLSKYPDRISLSVDLYLIGSGIIIATTALLVTTIVSRVTDLSPALTLKHD